MDKKIKIISKRTRTYRAIHKWIALPALVFMFIIGSTGLLLGWKKQTSLLPPTQKGMTAQTSAWLSLDKLTDIAQKYVSDSLHLDETIDRMDVRPDKGIVKIRFVNYFQEVQLDLQTGKILSVSTRGSDIIEKIHDGSILDYFIGTPGDELKLIYTTLSASSLILLSFSGFWLWYNPKRIRKKKHESES
ncbi:MAG: PepSY-associated TM helix domain-containing protein [Flavobacteriaceae bacterium]|nr:PepSY-associated TM helix domain-containing protein [Flavobacteriaceae bacterium]